MAVTAFFQENIFTSDSENLIIMTSTEQNEPVFFFRISTFKNGLLVATDNVYTSPTGINRFDTSIYTRYLIELDEVASFTFIVAEVVNGITTGNQSLNRKFCKGWLDSYTSGKIDALEDVFLTDFRGNTFDYTLFNKIYYSVFNNTDYRIRTRTYDADGVIITDVTTAVIPQNDISVSNEFIISATTKKVVIDMISPLSPAVTDTITYTSIKDCSNVVVYWRSEYGTIESMPFTHNTVSESNITQFEYESETGNSDYFKTFKDGGTIYTQDMDDSEQRKALNMLKSPDITLVYTDAYGDVRTRKIKVLNTNWSINQQYYEDTKAMSINFRFNDIGKSILL